jgi:hypothetical protein
MVQFDSWKERGFKAVAQDFFSRLPPGKAGERRGIDGNGDLLVHAPLDRGPAARTRLLPALAAASWYDSENDAPKLQVVL